MTAWPSLFPAPLVGFAAKRYENNAVRVESDYMPAQRSAGEDGLLRASASWLMSGYQLETFTAWYHYKLNDGSTWYGATLKMDTVAEVKQCRFVDGFAAEFMGGDLWTVTAEIEVY